MDENLNRSQVNGRQFEAPEELDDCFEDRYTKHDLMPKDTLDYGQGQIRVHDYCNGGKWLHRLLERRCMMLLEPSGRSIRLELRKQEVKEWSKN